MRLTEVRALPLGLYRVHWKERHGGGCSLAAIGMLENGDRWIAPVNWTRPAADNKAVWRMVERAALLDSR